ncbi:hypothetical protein CKO_04787 [Citrobacter koseri ATCC BAA-895]|uniref:Uncharacterized protein n=1 Tax=Citrobacter koseri (strain ATCC BAA-895 / CDC 4225-83 / SGSC4696) TaxID=290338 RepID=A8AQR9_CITK8|nr:hypothetical protein CKO_04787 [Citrobacter koseri ATCC BAA-895]
MPGGASLPGLHVTCRPDKTHSVAIRLFNPAFSRNFPLLLTA